MEYSKAISSECTGTTPNASIALPGQDADQRNFAGAVVMEKHPVHKDSVDARLKEVRSGRDGFRIPGRTAVVFVEPR